MNVHAVVQDLLSEETPLLAIPLFEAEEEWSSLLEDVDEAFGGALARARAVGDLSGRADDSQLFHAPEGSSGPSRVLVLGVGPRADFDLEAVRTFAGRAVRAAENRRLESLVIGADADGALDPVDAARTAAEGAVLAAWRYRELKTGIGQDDPAPVDVSRVGIGGTADSSDLEEAVRIGAAVGRGANFARKLQQRPGNRLTPTILADEAVDMAEELRLASTIMGPEEMREQEMGALLAVAQGSDQEPRLIILEHQGGEEGEPPLVLVGKGLTFDAGGISLKPPKGMEDMKFDMSGGAAVLGAMHAVAELDLPLNVIGVVPSSENLINGSAVKPGDVVRSREGKTIEIINTDAEGRLILADALSYAQSFEPAAMVDCATLTGACVVALGHHASAVMGTDDALVEELRGAGDRSGERCWPLPLWDVYRKQLDSETADFKNIGGRPAGSITAGCFLREFVGDVSWAHLDVAGTAYGEEPPSYLRKGAYGAPTRLLVEWVRSRSG